MQGIIPETTDKITKISEQIPAAINRKNEIRQRAEIANIKSKTDKPMQIRALMY